MAKDPKSKPEAEVEGDAPPPASKKKLIIIIAAVVLLAGVGGGAAWFMMHKKTDAHKVEAKHAEPVKAPVFLTLETFTLNLQPDPDEKFLQLDMQLQVDGNETVEVMKAQMPVVRNRLLLLLTSKKASEILTMEGKQQLSSEIVTELKKPFSAGAKPQEIMGVYFTSFVVQ